MLNIRSIRFQLILTVNTVLFLFVVGFLTYDYIRELNDRLDEKMTALQEEAKTMLPALLQLKHHGVDTIQDYVDDVCGRMEDSDSPSHHIAVEMDGELIQARSHHRQSHDLVVAMRKAAEDDRQRVRINDHDLVVGYESQSNTMVIVSEDVFDIRTRVLADVFRRMAGLFLLGLVAAAVVNFGLVRMVTRPLQSLVTKVREVGDGDFSTRLGTHGTAEFDFLSTEINSMSDALAAAERDRKIRLDKARSIQENLLPQNHISIPGMSIGTLYCPAEEVGGDYFDILPCGDDQTLVCVADATDHGVPAAMSAAMLKTLLLHAATRSSSPADILRQMNESFMKVHLCGDFASVILLRIDSAKRLLTYANAGHYPSWLIKEDQSVTDLLATGTFLGIDEETDWSEQTITLESHWRIAVSTDGITETFNADHEAYGATRLLNELVANSRLPAQETVDQVLESVTSFRGDRPQTDDVTMLILDL